MVARCEGRYATERRENHRIMNQPRQGRQKRAMSGTRVRFLSPLPGLGFSIFRFPVACSPGLATHTGYFLTSLRLFFFFDMLSFQI